MAEWATLANVPAFLLVFIRITAFFATLPLFSYRTIPAQYKVGFSFFLALILYISIEPPQFSIDEIFFMLMLKEAITGLFIGLLAYIAITAVQVAGGFIDFQMGFAIANVVDPQTGAQSPLIGQYLYTVTLLFILVTDGHHLMIDGIFYSYEAIEIDQFLQLQEESWIEFVIYTFNEMFISAFLMALPLVGCLFLVDVALGIIARTVPQLNVFVVGLPLKIFVALAVLTIVMGFYVLLIEEIFDLVLETMRGFIDVLGRS
ncbi:MULTISPECIES: flagellar biosynthetic protein FliR [Salimicrobium]|uniref:Flagellar biosynthetic protein FliR n=1 Tax=Salimicrobium humidisoli TaxID=2029857 RepID=A0ABX4HRQ5_9BACI|nr:MULTISPECIES: flagellar biosynthetic protein FliR [Salimicrobium]PBB05884.1 flagellar biosynthetic protein FliR [Salimicrobium humidisoli]